MEFPPISRWPKRLRLAFLILLGPLLALGAVDRALVLSASHWSWVAREVPPQLLDPYRVEGLLRSLEPGRRNLLLLGDSTAEQAFDADALERSFAPEGLRFTKITQGGAPSLSFGMLAEPLGRLGARAAVLMVSAPGLRSRGFLEEVRAYDVRALPAIFSAGELLSEPRFHLAGLVGQLHVLARHRGAMQQALLVRLGRLDWLDLQHAHAREILARATDPQDRWQLWVRERRPESYPNPNTRALEHLARTLRARGTRLLVTEAPLHPSVALLLGDGRLPRFREAVAALGQRHGFRFVSAPELGEFPRRDFADMVHLGETGRARFSELVATPLREALAAAP